MQSSHLLSASSCSYSASEGVFTEEDHNSKGCHSKIERKELSDMIEEKMNKSFGIQWTKFAKSVAIRFVTLKKQL